MTFLKDVFADTCTEASYHMCFADVGALGICLFIPFLMACGAKALKT